MGADSSDNATNTLTEFTKRMREAQASGGASGGGGGQAGGIMPTGFQTLGTTQGPSQAYGGGGNGASRPTQSDLEAIVNGKEATAADSAWDDPGELAVHALIHRAWALELERKGWNPSSEIGATHIKILRMAQAALRSIPKREPIA